MKFWVEFTRTKIWQEEVEVPDDLVFFHDDDDMSRGLVPESDARVTAWIRKHGKEKVRNDIPDDDSVIIVSDRITVDFEVAT